MKISPFCCLAQARTKNFYSERVSFKAVIVVIINCNTCTCILPRKASTILAKIPVDMCQFTVIALTGLKHVVGLTGITLIGSGEHSLIFCLFTCFIYPSSIYKYNILCLNIISKFYISNFILFLSTFCFETYFCNRFCVMDKKINFLNIGLETKLTPI